MDTFTDASTEDAAHYQSLIGSRKICREQNELKLKDKLIAINFINN